MRRGIEIRGYGQGILVEHESFVRELFDDPELEAVIDLKRIGVAETYDLRYAAQGAWNFLIIN